MTQFTQRFILLSIALILSDRAICYEHVLADKDRARNATDSSITQSGTIRSSDQFTNLKKLTLESSVQLAVQQNRTLQISQIERALERSDLQVARQKFYPQGQLIYENFTRESADVKSRSSALYPSATLQTPLGSRISATLNSSRSRFLQFASNDSSITLEVIQPLLRGAGPAVNLASIRIAEMNDAIGALNAKALLAEQITRVIIGYYDVIRADERVRLSTAALTRATELLSINDALIEAGRMAVSDRLQAEAQFASLEATLEQAINGREAAKLAFLFMLALPTETEIELEIPSHPQELFLNIDEQVSLAFQRSPQYLRALLTLSIANTDMLLAADARLWDVALVAGKTRSIGVGSAAVARAPTLLNDSFVGLRVSIPLGEQSARQNQARASTRVRTEELRLAELRQALTQDVTASCRDVATRWRQYMLAQKSLRLADQKLANEREKFKLGRSSNFVVVAYESDLQFAQNSVLNAEVDYILARAAVDLKTGVTTSRWKIIFADYINR